MTGAARAVATALVAGAMALACGPARAGTADEALVALQRSYRTAITVTMQFRERFRNEATGRTLEEGGRLWAQRPDRMRWEYDGEETKLFVMADGLAWFYVPDEETVWRMRVGDKTVQEMPALFLTGAGDLLTEFDAELLGEAGDGVRLGLTPKGGSDEYERLEVQLDSGGERLQSLQVHDVLGNVTEFLFTDEKRGTEPPPGAFEFSIPPGVELLDADP